SPYGVRVHERFSLRRLPEEVRPHVWPMDEGSQAVALALEVQAGERVLDLCAGGGGKTRLLLTLGAQVIAVDPDKGRLTAVKHRSAAEAGLACVRADGRSSPFLDGRFDKVLVDAPCSGTGTLRRAPDVVHRFDPRTLSSLARLQEDLVVAAARLVRPGGRVVYATCSLLPEENIRVIEAVRSSAESLRESGLPRELLPSEHGCDGFFVTTFERLSVPAT
ncbi:MAG: RsmB/NOP family class I SAM-dependent RNA methyltransferase, partial [Myxococcota bacterium]